MTSENDFWMYLDQLVLFSDIVIDRPKGSSHPRYPDLIYPLDYGYLEGTVAADKGGIDVWVGSETERTVRGIITTVDLLKRDAEIKILLGCTDDEMHTILAFLNNGDQRGILIRRD